MVRNPSVKESPSARPVVFEVVTGGQPNRLPLDGPCIHGIFLFVDKFHNEHANNINIAFSSLKEEKRKPKKQTNDTTNKTKGTRNGNEDI